MDLNILRSAVTLLSFVMFLGIIAWTFNRSRTRDFDEAAQLPFLQEESALPGLNLNAANLRGGNNE